MKKFLIAALLFSGLSGTLAQDEDDGFIREYSFQNRTLEEKLRQEISPIATLNSQVAFALLNRLEAISSLTSRDPAISWEISEINIREKWTVNGTDCADLRFWQKYHKLPVHGSQVSITMMREKEGWRFFSYSYNIADIKTAVPTLISSETALKSADAYLKKTYVLGKAPKFFDKEAKPRLSLIWSLERDFDLAHDKEEDWPNRRHAWHLVYVTEHSYYIEMEDHFPLPIGLYIDAVSGKVLSEVPRAITGCFGPSPKPKKPSK